MNFPEFAAKVGEDTGVTAVDLFQGMIGHAMTATVGGWIYFIEAELQQHRSPLCRVVVFGPEWTIKCVPNGVQQLGESTRTISTVAAVLTAEEWLRFAATPEAEEYLQLPDAMNAICNTFMRVVTTRVLRSIGQHYPVMSMYNQAGQKAVFDIGDNLASYVVSEVIDTVTDYMSEFHTEAAIPTSKRKVPRLADALTYVSNEVPTRLAVAVKDLQQAADSVSKAIL